MKTAVVVGASGFVGRELVRQLLDLGVHVRCLIRNSASLDYRLRARVEVYEGDIFDSRLVINASHSSDTVFHLVSKVHDLEELSDTGGHHRLTFEGTKAVFDGATSAGISTFVFMSTLAVYGDSELIRDETAECRPDSAYGIAKLSAEDYIFEKGRTAGVHVSALRPAMIYGPGCKGNLPRMIRMIDRSLFLPPPPINAKRSMVHVSDVATAAILTANSELSRGERYIVTDETPLTVREMYELILDGLGKRVPPWHIPTYALKILAQTGDVVGAIVGRRFVFDTPAFEKLVSSACFSSKKITSQLGFHPSLTFRDSISEILSWYRSNTKWT